MSESEDKMFRKFTRRYSTKAQLFAFPIAAAIVSILILPQHVSCFTIIRNKSLFKTVLPSYYNHHYHHRSSIHSSSSSSSTQLSVKWFGGGFGLDSSSRNSDELLGVKIERTSPNSRRIAGEIIISKSIDDVWAILTDYDNLAIHVPNLVESKRVYTNNNRMNISSHQQQQQGQQGDGQYKCRLYQKGAQKIVGFEFGASVTMDMTENIRLSNVVPSRVLKLGNEKKVQVGEQRRIYFKCVESQFFSEFDGEWKCSWIDDPNDAFELATKVEYVVDVRPRGPVPVQALEWRIREDVPTNLRAVKLASMNLGKEGVLKLREKNGQHVTSSAMKSPSNSKVMSAATLTSRAKAISGDISSTIRRQSSSSTNLRFNGKQNIKENSSTVTSAGNKRLAAVNVQWYDDETMATYLESRKSKH